MAKQQASGDSETVTKLTKEARIEEERMRDVLLLVENLLRQEEITLKLIIDCLYDVGSVNLINQKFRSRSLKGLMKWVSRLSKPAFRIVALRWVKKNCPELVTKWLYAKVKFKPKKAQAKPLVVTTATVKPDVVIKPEDYKREILRLHSQVRALTVLLVGVTFTLGGGMAWSIWKDQVEDIQPASHVKTVFVDVFNSSSACPYEFCDQQF